MDLIERRSIDYIPEADRHGKTWHLWPVWFSGGAHLAALATGSVGIALGGELPWMVVAVVVGTALGTFFMAFHAAQGPQLGLPQMIQSRPQFGYQGALLIWFVALIAFLGFNSFNEILAAQTLHALFGFEKAPVIYGVGVFALILALLGYDAIHWCQRWTAYIVILTLLLFSTVFFRHFPEFNWQPDSSNFKLTPFLAQMFAAASYQLSWAIYVSDYSRYLPKTSGVAGTFLWTYLGAFIGSVWMIIVGTVACAAYPRSEVSDALRRLADDVLPGFGKPLLVITLAGLITSTTLNFYGASLTMLSIGDSMRPLKPTRRMRLATLVIGGVIATVFALHSSKGFSAAFGAFLSLLLYLLTPWSAVNLFDFYFLRRGHYSVPEIFNPGGIYGRWNWMGLGAYAVGFVAMIPFFSVPEFVMGPIALRLGGADLAMPVGFVVSGVVYLWAMCRFNQWRAIESRYFATHD